MNLPEYTSIFGVKEGVIVKMFVESRPKWLLLILYLRKLGAMTLSDISSRINIRYNGIRNAVKYLGGVDLRSPSPPPIPTTPLGIDPIVYVIRMPPRKKIIVLTEYGEQFANRVVNYLKEVALRLGRVDVETRYGIPKVMLMTELKRRYPDADQVKLLTRFVSFDELIAKLIKVKPELVQVMRPELIDAVPIELEIATDVRTIKKVLLHLVL
ncbi:MAG: hypothetical protein QXE75_05020 [Sulfolobales archaeon]